VPVVKLVPGIVGIEARAAEAEAAGDIRLPEIDEASMSEAVEMPARAPTAARKVNVGTFMVMVGVACGERVVVMNDYYSGRCCSCTVKGRGSLGRQERAERVLYMHDSLRSGLQHLGFVSGQNIT
jgi:hypothetical protein